MSRYRAIHCLIWNDDKFPFASDACQLVFFHVLTTPMSSPFGLYKASLEALAAEKRWDTKAYAKAFEEALGNAFLKYDERSLVILIPKFLRYNPPNNPNVLIGWKSLYDEIPNCPLKHEFYQILQAYVEGLHQGFHEAFAKAWPQPLAIQDQYQYQEQNKKPPSLSPPVGGSNKHRWSPQRTFPSDFPRDPPEDFLEWARQECPAVNVQTEWKIMVEHEYKSPKTRFWSCAKTWMRNAAKFNGQGPKSVDIVASKSGCIGRRHNGPLRYCSACGYSHS